MKKIFYSIFIIILAIHIQKPAYSQDDCIPKESGRLVNDYTGTLSSGQIQQLESRLIQYNNSTSTQIAVVLVADLCGYDRASFTYTLGENWGIGQKGKDNGVVIMVKPTGGTGQREVFIAPGYGLEGVIPDAIANRIIDKEMIPRFKTGDIYGGIVAGVDVVMQLAGGEFTAQEYKERTSGGEGVPAVFILLVFIFVILTRVGGTRSYARRNNIGFWTALWLMSSSSRGRSGGFGGFSSGGGSFGGFGGGSFGGGGAGGSW